MDGASQVPVNMLPGTVMPQQAADPSVAKHGLPIKPGQQTSRLALDAYKNDARLFVEVIAKSDLSQPFAGEQRVLRINGQQYFRANAGEGGEVFVKVADFAARFHLKPEKVIAAAEQGTVGALLEKRKDFSEVLDNYNEIMDHYERSAKADTFNADRNIGLSRELLMKMVRVGLRELNQAPANQEGLDTTIRGTAILASRDIQGNLQLVQWSGNPAPKEGDHNLLGEGGFGVVQSAYNIAIAQYVAVKMAKDPVAQEVERLAEIYDPQGAGFAGLKQVAEEEFGPERQRGIEEVLNENKMLVRINENGQLPGIAFAPHFAVNITGGDQAKVGMVGHYYSEGDFGDFMVRGGLASCSQMEALEATVAVLEGIADVHDQGIIHGDIKHSNAFVTYTDDGRLDVRLGDWGSARPLEDQWNELLQKARDLLRSGSDEELQEFYDTALGSMTPEYCSRQELAKILDVVDKAAQLPEGSPQIDGLKDEFFARQKARDALATGITLYTLLTGEDAFEHDDQRFLVLTSGVNDPARANPLLDRYPEEVSSCILGMLDADPMSRWTARFAREAIFTSEDLKASLDSDQLENMLTLNPYGDQVQEKA